MSKRGNENAQLRPDEVEALNNRESTSGGVFQRAPPEELAQRRMIKLTKRPASGQSLNFGGSDTSISSGVTANPFGGFSGLVTSSTPVPAAANPFSGFNGLVTSGATAPAAVANPFGGFSGLVTSSTSVPAAIANPFSGFSGLVASSTSVPATTLSSFGASDTIIAVPQGNFKNDEVSFPTNSSSSANSLSLESEYKKKMRKLNTSILSWMDRQIIDHPLSIWKDGMKDYVRYSTDISDKFGENLQAAEQEFASSIKEPKTQIDSGYTKSLESSTTSLPSLPIPFMSQPTTSSSVSTGAAAFNWSVPGLSSTLKSSTTSSASFTVPSFSFPVNASFSSSVNTPAVDHQIVSSSVASTAIGDGEEEDGEPIMEAEKVLRNEDDKDEIVCDCNCKLHRFDSGKGDNGKGEWIDVGKGIFRVTKCTESGKQRMLVRNSVGKIIFNAAFYKGMKVDRKSKGMLSFGVVTDVSGGLRNFLLKVKEADVEVVFGAMQFAISSVR